MKIILAIAALAISTTALAMGVPPTAGEREAAAEKVIPQAELVKARVAAQTIVNARQPDASTAAEIKATGAIAKASETALFAAIKARLDLNLAEYNKQAAIVFASKDKACAILSGC